MITDKLNTFAKDLALNTGAAGTYLLGDTIPLSAARDIGNGVPIYLVISVSTSATSGGAATCKFALASDSTEAIATNGDATIHLETSAFEVADMAAGETLFNVVIPMEGLEYEGHLGILQTTGVAAFTGGKVNAFLTQTPDAWKPLEMQTGYVA